MAEDAPQNAVVEAGDAPSYEAAKNLPGLGGLMQNPEILAALQGQLNTKFGFSPSYIKTLPKVVQRRIKALKKLQSDMINVEAKFYEEVHELECKYAAKYQPLYDRRKDVVSGGVEPTDSDCEWPSDEEEEEGELAEGVEKVKINGEQEKEDEEKPPGIPSFWLTIFKNVDMLAEMVQDHDEPILENLTDIQITFKQADPMSFKLHFHFKPNEYFSDPVLTKEYIMRATPDPEDPLGYEGPEIVKCSGCKIDWQTGKNVTVKLIKKVQKHQGRGQKRTITKSVQNDSFFNFFTPPEHQIDQDLDEETQELLAADYEIGHFFRERIIPRAILYFTGEALEDDEDFEDEEDEEGEDEGEYDEDADEDFSPAK